MSLVTFAIVNGMLAVAILAALVCVCRLPFRLDRSSSTLAAEPIRYEVRVEPERLAA
jgi:hypothetical protein